MKPPVSFKGETYGIYGYSDYATPMTKQMNSGRSNLAASSSNIKRLIMKTDNDKTNDLTVNLRRNLLKKCQNIRIRTDIQAEGLCFVKTWLLELIPQFEAELSAMGETESMGEPFEFASLTDDFLPFIAKNQFKKQVRKHAPMPKRDSVEEKIALIMDPMKMVLTKDHIKVLIQILPKTQQEYMFLPQIASM